MIWIIARLSGKCPLYCHIFFFQAEDGIRDYKVTGVQTCALPISLENGAANFFVLHDDARLLAENTTQAFLGMSVQCAKCHNHPMEKWTNDEYYQFAKDRKSVV